MATKKEIKDLIELRVTKGKPSDDLEISETQIYFEMDMARSFLIKREADKKKKDIVDSSLMSNFDCLEIIKEKLDCGDDCNEYRYYVQLPADVIKLPNDGGVVLVTTAGGTLISRIRPIDLLVFSKIKLIMPSKEYPTFTRIGKKIILHGASRLFLEEGSVNLTLIVSSTDVLSEDDTYPIQDYLIGELIMMVEQALLRQIQGKQDLENDGIQ